MSKLWEIERLNARVTRLEGALKKIQRHCEVAATHAAIYAVADTALRGNP